MKRLLVLLVLLFLVSCGGKSADMVNPVVACDCLADVNEAVGVNIVPFNLMGRRDIRFAYINTEPRIGEYVFSLDDFEFCLRASHKVDSDISGLFISGNEFRPDQSFTLFNRDYKLHRFFFDGVQYTLTVKDEGAISEDRFKNIAYVFETSQGKDDLLGEYGDLYSKRATASVSKDNGFYNIVVHWSSSAVETYEFMMVASFQSGRLEYRGEKMFFYKSNGPDSFDTSVTESNNIGYFVVSDGRLLWSGAALDWCRDCVFEKVK